MSRGTCNLQTLKLLQAVVKITLNRQRPCSCSKMSHDIQDLIDYMSLSETETHTHCRMDDGKWHHASIRKL